MDREGDRGDRARAVEKGESGKRITLQSQKARMEGRKHKGGWRGRACLILDRNPSIHKTFIVKQDSAKYLESLDSGASYHIGAIHKGRPHREGGRGVVQKQT